MESPSCCSWAFSKAITPIHRKPNGVPRRCFCRYFETLWDHRLVKEGFLMGARKVRLHGRRMTEPMCDHFVQEEKLATRSGVEDEDDENDDNG